jgi:glycosyltransferase involved in cell wall biosynthesis
MRIKRIVGVGFTFYKIARLLNPNSEFEIHVFLTSAEIKRARNDFAFREDWVHEIQDEVMSLNNLRKGNFWKLRFPDAELYLQSDSSPLFASPPKGSKSIFLPIGFDLTEQPFVRFAIRRGHNLRVKSRLSLLSLIQARRIRNVDEIWCSPFDVFKLALGKLKLTNRIDSFVPFPINYEAHSIDNQHKFLERKADFSIFFPGRVMTTKSIHDLESGQTKGAEVAVQGFIDFIELSNSNSELIIVDNSSSTDTLQIKDLLENNNVSHLVKWITPKSEIGRISSAEMASIYRDSDVVLGDFGGNWFGQTAIECGIHAKPFVTKISKEFMEENFGENPFILVNSSSDISAALVDLYLSENKRKEFGRKMNNWFEKHFSEKVVTDWYLKEIKRILG